MNVTAEMMTGPWVRWEWCPTCRVPCVVCLDCGHRSCTGHDCDNCHELFEEVGRMIDSGTEPDQELIEKEFRLLEIVK